MRKRKIVRLTKKRKAAVEVALSIDDVLYEILRREREELHREWQRLWQAKHVIAVHIETGPDGMLRALQIHKTQVTEHGTIVIVR